MTGLTQLERKVSILDSRLSNNVWPVGSIFLSAVSTNPSSLLGFGTWSVFGAGKMLIGLDSGDTDFDAAEEVGGAKQKVVETLLTNVILPQYIVVRMWKSTA